MKSNLKFKRVTIRKERKASRVIDYLYVNPSYAIVYFLRGMEKHLFVQATRTDKVILASRIMTVKIMRILIRSTSSHYAL